MPGFRAYERAWLAIERFDLITRIGQHRRHEAQRRPDLQHAPTVKVGQHIELHPLMDNALFRVIGQPIGRARAHRN